MSMRVVQQWDEMKPLETIRKRVHDPGSGDELPRRLHPTAR